MKLRLTKSGIEEGTGFVGRAVTKKSHLPVMTMLLIDAGETVRIAGANATYTAITSIDGVIEEPGACCVPADRLMSYVSTLPSGSEIVLETDATHLKLKSGRSKAKFPIIDAMEFPELPERKDGFSLDGAMFLSMLSKVGVASSSDKAMAVLCGVCLSGNDEDLFVAAADGYRMAAATLDAKCETGEWILPNDTVDALQRMGGARIEVGVFPARMVFSDGKRVLGTSLVDGSFPPKRHHIAHFESLGKTEVVIECEPLRRAVLGAMVFGEENDNFISINFSEGTASISATGGSGVGSGESEVRGDIEGPEVQIGFNGKYLLEGLASIDTERVVMRIADSNSQVVLRDLNESSYRHIITPMSLAGR